MIECVVSLKKRSSIYISTNELWTIGRSTTTIFINGSVRYNGILQAEIRHIRPSQILMNLYRDIVTLSCS